MSGLTLADLALLELLAIGAERKDIARALGVSQAKVTSQLTTIQEKLEARNSTHAMARAYRTGVLQ